MSLKATVGPLIIPEPFYLETQLRECGREHPEDRMNAGANSSLFLELVRVKERNDSSKANIPVLLE